MSDRPPVLSLRLGHVVMLGVVLRLVFLLWAGELDFWADEGRYVYQALAWNHFGFYLGSPAWVWPPAYPGFLAVAFAFFGEGGVFAAKLGQVLLSGVVGAAVMLIARHLFDERTARVAGLAWAVYLPLAAYTHYLWPETIFLALLMPAVYLFLTVVRPRNPVDVPLRLAACGALLGAACLVKEAPLPLVGFLPLILLASPAAGGFAQRLAGCATIVFAAGAVLLPWTLRNHEVYGRVVLSGSTLGENLYQGINAHYVNFDYGGKGKYELIEPSPAYHWLAKPPAGARPWGRSAAPNTIDRTWENAARARHFMGKHPVFFLKSRVKKLADWVTPLSFFVRHQRNGVYQSSLSARWIRAPLVLYALLATALMLAGGALGTWLAVPRGPARWTFLAVVLTFLSGAVVVSMSRYRLPVEPSLLIAAAGLWTGRGAGARWYERKLARASLALLVLLWVVNAREVLEMLRRTL